MSLVRPAAAEVGERERPQGAEPTPAEPRATGAPDGRRSALSTPRARPEAPRQVELRPVVKYQKTRLKEGQAAEIEARLIALFESEKPYRDVDLTLSTLAQRLDVPPYHLSQVLNDRFGASFHDQVNLARVKELKRRLLDPTLSAEKILALGIDCGFSFKSTLNGNFKKYTGLTLSQFRDQIVREARNAAGRRRVRSPQRSLP